MTDWGNTERHHLLERIQRDHQDSQRLTRQELKYELIQKLSKGQYLELYARRRYNDRWTAWGDQLA